MYFYFCKKILYMDLLTHTWHWSVAGFLIAVVMLMLNYFGKVFGMSSNLRSLCAMTGVGKKVPFFDWDWKSQRWNLVVVVGASNGIGRAAASLIASRGAKVVIADMNPEGLAQLALELKLPANQVHILDVSSQNGVSTFIATIIKEHGRIDALVNSAGIVGQSNVKIEDLDWSTFEKTIQVNLYGIPSFWFNK